MLAQRGSYPYFILSLVCTSITEKDGYILYNIRFVLFYYFLFYSISLVETNRNFILNQNKVNKNKLRQEKKYKFVPSVSILPTRELKSY